MTSVALTKVLFERWLGSGRRFTSMAPDVDRMLREHDAGLLIGDTALQVDRSRYLAFDLAEEWIRFTGKPFVFAVWAIRRAALANAPADLASIFQTSRDHGLQAENVDFIAREWAGRVDSPKPKCALTSQKTFTTTWMRVAWKAFSCSIVMLRSAELCPGLRLSSFWKSRSLRPPSRLMMSSILDRVEGLQ